MKKKQKQTVVVQPAKKKGNTVENIVVIATMVAMLALAAVAIAMPTKVTEEAKAE